MPYITECLESQGTVEIPVRGRSMWPMLREGKDTVILSSIQEPLKKFDIPLYQRADGSYVLHRIVSTKEGYTCSGDNQFTYEKGLTDTQMLAVLTAFRRGERLVSLHSPLYWLYVRLWCATRALRYFLFRVLRKLKRLLCKK